VFDTGRECQPGREGHVASDRPTGGFVTSS
jgi:hypothetical protein